MAQSTIQLIEGDQALARKLAGLPDKVQAKVMRSAMSRGLTPLAQAARRLQRHPSLRKLIAKAVVRRKRDRDWIGKVYMKPAKERTVRIDGRVVGFEVVGNILEFGSLKRHIAPQPFMRPARRQAGPAAIRALADQVRKKLRQMGAT